MKFDTPTAEIKGQALRANLQTLRQMAEGANVVGMVKANAYGHGLLPMAKLLEAEGVAALGVATVAEGEALRAGGIGCPILLMGGAGFAFAPERAVLAQLTPMISSYDELKTLLDCLILAQSSKPFEVHLDLDTGMARAGFWVGEDPSLLLSPALALLKKHRSLLNLQGVATHFARGELAGCETTDVQLVRFRRALAYIESEGVSFSVIHAAKSAAIWHGKEGSSGHEVWVRPGIALYGVTPFADRPKPKGLSPVLSLRAPIVGRKRIAKGTPVGYGGTWAAARDTELALLRVGYADGYPRALANRAQVLIAGRRAPVVGRVSMDLTVIDVSDVLASEGERVCEMGSLVTLIGAEGGEEVSAFELAALCDTIPYEILTGIGNRVERIYR